MYKNWYTVKKETIVTHHISFNSNQRQQQVHYHKTQNFALNIKKANMNFDFRQGLQSIHNFLSSKNCKV